ncbi:hypothetical protein AGMMS50268_35300 [Spirochaetia bacterium]|nr:hypothetical protein AGMMS50268_35300 [Spirochaetia bacterium]
MSDFAGSGIGDDEKRNRRFHITFHILIFAILVGASFLGLRPLWDAMQFRMAGIRDGLIGRAEGIIGRRIEYASMGPSLLGGLDIRDIRVYDAEGGTVSSVNSAPVVFLSRLRLSWSLMDLIQKKPGAVRSIRIDRPFINFDIERDRDLLDLFVSPQIQGLASSRSIAEWIPPDVLFRVRNGRFVITGDGTFSLDRVNFDASVKNERITVQGSWNAAASLPEVFGAPLNVGMAGRISGYCSGDFKNGNALITFPYIAGDFFRFGSLGLNVNLRDKLVQVRKINDRSPLDLSLDYDLASRNLRASFRCEDFTPRDLVSLSGDWRSVNPWLAIRNTGEASFEMDAHGKIGYTADISGAIPRNLPMGGYAFVLKAGGDEDYVRFDRLTLKLKQGDITFQGGLGLKPLAPNGTISIRDFSLAKQGTEALNAGLSVSTEGREISIFGENISLGEVELSALDLSLRRDADGLSFAASALRFRDLESYEDVSLSTLSMEGAFADDPRHIEASFRLDSFSAADLISMLKPFDLEPDIPFPAEGLAKNASITTEIFITTDFEHVLYNAPRLLIAYDGRRDFIGLFSVAGTDRRFELNEGQLIWTGGSFRLAGFVDFSNPMDLSFSLSTSYKDTSYFFEGMFLDRRSLSIQGSYGLRAYISAAGDAGYSGYVEADDIPIPFRGQFVRLRLSTSLRYNSPAFWSLDINRIELAGVTTPGSSGTMLRISGNADQDGALFDELFFDDGRGILEGRAGLFWNRDFTDLRGQFNITNSANTEVYTAELSWAERRLELNLFGTGMQFARFMENAYSAVATGNVRLSWNSMESFHADMNLSSLFARYQNTDLEASVSASLDHEEFLLRDLRVRAANVEADMPLLRINRRDALAGAEGQIRGSVTGRPLDLSFIMESRFKPIDSWLNLADALGAFEGAVTVAKASLGGREIEEPFNFVFSREKEALSLTGGPMDMIRFRVSDTGDFYAGFSNPSPIRGSVVGTITQDTIDALASDIYVDFPALWAFVPANTEVKLVGGYATASIQIRGSLGDPEFFGTAYGHSVLLEVPNFLAAEVRPIPMLVNIEGNEMTFGPLPAAVGNGMGMVSGWFRFDRWIPNIFSIDITVPRETPLPFQFDIQGVLARGIVSGTMNISMEDMSLRVIGDLFPDETEISLDAAEMARQADMFDNTTIPVAVDIGITAGRKVEFLWPTREFPVLQTYADMGTRARITADTLARRFSFTGDIKLRSGELFYFERSFYIRNGILSFKENEQSFDPRITVRAEARDRSSEGPVTISMVVDNAPLQSFTARFESSPALSQMEILSLLGQNITGAPGSGEDGTIRNAFIPATADILAQFQLVRRMERGVRDFLHLDMFSMRTQVLQNAVFQATGLQDPVDRISGVGNYFDNTSVFIGKYVGSDMFAQAMLSLRYDANKVDMGGYTFEPDFGIELRSPLVNIRWNLVPVHPETWYISDCSFTLTWNWSF